MCTKQRTNALLSHTYGEHTASVAINSAMPVYSETSTIDTTPSAP